MCKVAIITNIPSPYRVDLFYYLQTYVKEHTFHVIYTSANEDNRQWRIPEQKLLNTHFLDSRIIKIAQKMDTKYIHLPANISKELNIIMPDVIIASEYNPAALQSLLWSKTHGKKFIHWTDGTLHSERNIGKIQKLMRKLICDSADACIASSTRSKEKLLAWGVPEEKIFISLLTVDITKYREAQPEPVPGRILYVGSMIVRKGLDLLLDALKYVDKDFCLHIVGNGTKEQQAELEQQAKRIGISDKVVFYGFRQGAELVQEYAEAQVFVLPTREDCFGLVLLEAMCADVPIVASRYADGAYDVVTEGKNGYIADPFDPKAFGSAIHKAMEENHTLRGSVKEKTECFSFSSVCVGFTDAIRYVNKGKLSQDER